MLIGNGEFYHGDCLDVMRGLPDASVDMVLCDLPYGTTACSWDSVIPFEPLWAEYWRIAKPNAAIVLTASQPFSTALISSAMREFRYCWYWLKNRPTGFANAKKQPLRKMEDVAVFYRSVPSYFPQGLIYAPKTMRNSRSTGGATVQGAEMAKRTGSLRSPGTEYVQEFTNYPTHILEFDSDTSKLHPTQKPVALFEYLIRTYTQPGDTVLDNCLGSGTTAIAAERSGRRWIGIERDEGYYNAALARIWTECAA